MNPDRAAVQKVLDLPAQRFGQLARTVEREADHVDDHIRLQLADALSERAIGFGALALQPDLRDRAPGAVWLIGLALAAADGDDFVAGRDHARHQVGAHVAAAADDHNPHRCLLASYKSLASTKSHRRCSRRPSCRYRRRYSANPTSLRSCWSGSPRWSTKRCWRTPGRRPGLTPAWRACICGTRP